MSTEIQYHSSLPLLIMYMVPPAITSDGFYVMPSLGDCNCSIIIILKVELKCHCNY